MSNKLIKKEETTTAIAVPDYLSSVKSAEGFEELAAGSFTIPRLTLLQSSSALVKKKLAQSGHWQNSITEQVFGDKIETVLIKAASGAIYMNMKEGMKCKSNDGKVNIINGGKCSECWLSSNYADWSNGAPRCTATFDFVVAERASLLTSAPNVMAMTFRRTGYKFAKNILSRARALNKPLYAQSYEFGSAFVDHPEGGYDSPTVNYKGWLSEDEFKAAAELFKIFQTKEFIVHDDEAPQQEVSDSNEDLKF